jgi:ubiquinone/menaquinone biosynthesis C-methylase UbiE
MSLKEPINFDKVADIYDYYVHADFDIPFFLKETENLGGEILELMCGTGRVSIPLLEAGRNLVCVDYAQGMLDKFAEKIQGKNFNVELIKADVTTLDLGRQFNKILLPFHSLQEILDAALQLNALKSIYKHLSENGEFICTLQNPNIRLQNADGALRVIGKYKIDNSHYLIVSYTNQLQNEIVTGFQFYERYDQRDRLIEKRALEINFRPVDYKAFIQMAGLAGFEIAAVYGDYNHGAFHVEQSPFMIFKLKKTGNIIL